MKPQPISKGRECLDAIEEEEIKTDDIEEEKKEHKDRRSLNLNEQASIDFLEQEMAIIDDIVEA